VEEAMANLREAMELYLETSAMVHKTVDKPSSVFVTSFTL
jgi:predicted RNase H-like HicB family nuclease